MSDKIHGIVTDLLEGIHGIAKSETVVGEPLQAGDAMVIPIHKLRVAFGVGTAKAGAKSARAGGDTGGMAAGGAIELDPIAAIAVGRDGIPRILTVDGHAEGTWSALLSEVPDLMARIIDTLGERASAEVKARFSAETMEGAKSKAELTPKDNPEK